MEAWQTLYRWKEIRPLLPELNRSAPMRIHRRPPNRKSLSVSLRGLRSSLRASMASLRLHQQASPAVRTGVGKQAKEPLVQRHILPPRGRGARSGSREKELSAEASQTDHTQRKRSPVPGRSRSAAAPAEWVPLHANFRIHRWSFSSCAMGYSPFLGARRLVGSARSCSFLPNSSSLAISSRSLSILFNACSTAA